MRASQTINRGHSKVTKNQIKKHVSQMTQHEILFLERRIQLISGSYSIANHFLETGRLIDIMTVEQLLNSPNLQDCIIEYSKLGNCKRVLLRSTFSSNITLKKNGVNYLAEANLCLVINIYTGHIVTGYWNEVEDNHNSVNMSRYDSALKICS